MNSFSNKVKKIIDEYKSNEIIVAKSIFNKYFEHENENLFYKVLERLCGHNQLKRIGKGIYVKPKVTKYGTLSLSDREIIEFYTSKNEGIGIGYDLYNSKGITTQTAHKYKVISNKIYEKKKKINNVEIYKLNFKLNPKRKETIEILEILENINKIEDINYIQFKNLINEYIKGYNDKETTFVLDNMKYKKSTIASLKHFLDKNKIDNKLGTYLSALSKYKIIEG